MLYIIGATVCAIIIALMALDIRNEMRHIDETKAAKLAEDDR